MKPKTNDSAKKRNVHSKVFHIQQIYNVQIRKYVKGCFKFARKSIHANMKRKWITVSEQGERGEKFT